MTNDDYTKNKKFYIHVRYTVGENKDIVVIDEDVEVTEEVYRAYKRPLWAEDKRKERASRCQVGKGNGKTKRCNDDCSKCAFFRSGTNLSLERLKEDFGHTEAAPIDDVADITIYNDLLQELCRVLNALDPKSRRICEAIMNGKTDKEIASELGYAARTTFSSQKYKLFEKLRTKLKDYR